MIKIKQLSLAGMLCLTFSASAQFFIGGQVNYNNYYGSSGVDFFGLGINGEKSIKDNAIRVSFNYGLPAKLGTSFSLYYVGTGLYAGDVSATIKYNFANIFADYKYFIGDGNSEDGGMYAFGGLGLTMATVKYTLDPYNETFYTTNNSYSRETYFQPYLRVGAGYELGLDFGNVFFEAFGNIPANTVNGATVYVSFPFSYGANAGVKFPIGR